MAERIAEWSGREAVVHGYNQQDNTQSQHRTRKTKLRPDKTPEAPGSGTDEAWLQWVASSSNSDIGTRPRAADMIIVAGPSRGRVR